MPDYIAFVIGLFLGAGVAMVMAAFMWLKLEAFVEWICDVREKRGKPHGWED